MIGINTTVPNIFRNVHSRVNGEQVFCVENKKEPQSPKETTSEIFPTGVYNLKFLQGNIGDCFLLAPLYSLSLTPKGTEILKNMVKTDDNGNYIVEFNKKAPIVVKSDELNGEIYANGTIKHSVDGDLSLKAIERAYAKLTRQSSNTANFMTLNRGGFPEQSLWDIAGIKSTKYATKNKVKPLLKEIESNGIENYVLTCSTPQLGKYGKYMNSNGKFITAHAYSIKSIDTKSGTIGIVNPHDTKKSELLKIEDFEKMFDFIYVAHFE